MKNIFPRTSFEYSDDNLKEINDILRNSKRSSSRFENQTRYRSIFEPVYTNPPKILSLFYSRRGNFILRSNPRPLLSLPNPILIRPSTIHYDNKAASENPSLEPPPLHPLETWQIQNSLRLNRPSSRNTESQETSPFSRTPNFLPLLSFFLEPPLIIVTVGRVIQPRCKGNAIGRAGRVNVSSVSDVFRAFVSSISRFVRDRLRIWNRGLAVPFPLSLAAHVFLANSAVASTRIFSPRSGHQFLTTFRPI